MMETNKEKNFASAIVYLYNEEQLVIQFLQNLEKELSNNFLTFEIILVNDKSTDKCVSIIKNYLTTRSGLVVTIVNMSFHQGIESAMNAGIGIAIGDFVFEFDSVFVDYDWSILMSIYQKSLTGYDIVNASSSSKAKLTSSLFYKVFNKNANLQYKLSSETFRVLTRRAINRVNSISKTIPYRKAIYANAGLKMATLSYKPTKQMHTKSIKNRSDFAINSLILFSDIAYKFTLTMAIFMVLITVGVAVYAFIYYLCGNPVEGWTTTILFLSFAFFGLFVILAMVVKYLSTIVNLIFSKKEYLFESIEKI
jgi:glycosyltransferase involved in cell wall biosynthesis